MHVLEIGWNFCTINVACLTAGTFLMFSCIFNNTYNNFCNREFGGTASFTYDIFAGMKTDDFAADKAVYTTVYTSPVVYSEL